MNLLNESLIKKICQQRDIHPSKKSGQNFLIDPFALDNMVLSSRVQKTDNILEIGPGLGVLTMELVKHAKEVLCVELDKKLFSQMKDISFGVSNLKLINADVLSLSNQEIISFFTKADSYKLVSNLPYSISSSVLKKFLSQDPKPSEMTIMLQKEVGQRICASTGDMSILAISVQIFSCPEITAIVPKTSFWPRPEIDSVIVRITDIQSNSEVEKRYGIKLPRFFQMVKIGFSAKRKKLQNNLSAGFKISKQESLDLLTRCHLDINIRAQDLSLEDWVGLVKAYWN